VPHNRETLRSRICRLDVAPDHGESMIGDSTMAIAQQKAARAGRRGGFMQQSGD
jgi:hypothetical protein